MLKTITQFIFNVNIQYKHNVREAVERYESSLALDGNPKRFHAYLRCKKTNKPSVGPLLVDDVWHSDCRSMADHLASQFSSVFSDGVLHDPHPYQVSDSLLQFGEVTVDEVFKSLNKLKLSPGCGPDGLPSIVLRKCASALCYPLYLVFSKSISCMKVPLEWKLANVLPLFKSGVHSNPSNYRPISLTSVCSKSLERIIVSKLYDYLYDNDLISPQQFGFRAGLSVCDQLLYAYDYISLHVDSGCAVDVLYFDYSKAFDVINHGILLNKLADIGVTNPLLGWLRDFLLGRRMKVVVHGSSSDAIDVLSGVPQGSVVGPVLFLVYINHIISGLVSKVVLFADDLKLFLALPLTNLNDGCVVMQNDVSLLHHRSLSWGLNFSVNKCARIHFCRYNSMEVNYLIGANQIPNKDVFRDLGVLVDSSLKFHLHVREVFCKANGVANNILKSTVCRTPEFMIQVFTTHIRPIIDFCSALWNTGYVGDLRLLESVQRRWTREISGMSNLSYAERLSILDFYSIKGRLYRDVHEWPLSSSCSLVHKGCL